MNELLEPITSFYANNTELSIGIIVSVVIAFVVKPKEIGKILGVLAAIAIIGYLIMTLIDVVNTGIDKKSDAGARTDKQYRDKEF